MKLKRRDGDNTIEWRVVWVVELTGYRVPVTETWFAQYPSETGARNAATQNPGDLFDKFKRSEPYTVKSVQVQSRLIGPWLLETERQTA